MKILSIQKATPMGNGIIVTCDRYTEDECSHMGILDTTRLGKIKEFQTVVSIGEFAKTRGIGVGDFLALNFDRYKKSKNIKRENSLINDTDEHYSKEVIYELPVLLLADREHMLIDVSDIELKIDEHEYIIEGEDSILNNTELILT